MAQNSNTNYISSKRNSLGNQKRHLLKIWSKTGCTRQNTNCTQNSIRIDGGRFAWDEWNKSNGLNTHDQMLCTSQTTVWTGCDKTY